MNNGNYNSMREVIDILRDAKVNYLVMRNYENLLCDEIYQGGHGDVDVLCENSALFATVVGAKPYTKKVKAVCNDGTHYYIRIKGEEVSLDLRHIGDGYYCKQWQTDMLSRKIEKAGFYVMNEEDYFYSLIHHSILQKPRLSPEYFSRLCEMADSLGITVSDSNPRSFMLLLEKYMRSNGYVYEFPKDIFVPLKLRLIDKKLLEKDCRLAYKHWKFDSHVFVNSVLVTVKHTIFK